MGERTVLLRNALGIAATDTHCQIYSINNVIWDYFQALTKKQSPIALVWVLNVKRKKPKQHRQLCCLSDWWADSQGLIESHLLPTNGYTHTASLWLYHLGTFWRADGQLRWSLVALMAKLILWEETSLKSRIKILGPRTVAQDPRKKGENMIANVTKLALPSISYASS